MAQLGLNTPDGCIRYLNGLVDEANEEIAKRVALVQLHANKTIGNWEQNVQEIWEENKSLTTTNQQLGAALAEANRKVTELEKEIERLTYTKAQKKQGKKKERKRGRRARSDFEGS